MPSNTEFTGSSHAHKTRGRGRPEDPDLEDRVMRAALELYSSGGWKGFTYHKLAINAGVGKNALYRRWPEKLNLLTDLVKARWSPVADKNMGSFKEDIHEYATQIIERLGKNQARFTVNIHADSFRYDEIKKIVGPVSLYLTNIGTTIGKRAIERGEIDAKIDPTLVHHMVYGTIFSWIEQLNQNNKTFNPKESEIIVDQVITMVFRAMSSK